MKPPYPPPYALYGVKGKCWIDNDEGAKPDDPNNLSIDVGVHNFTPISFEYVASLMAKKMFKPLDHHGS